MLSFDFWRGFVLFGFLYSFVDAVPDELLLKKRCALKFGSWTYSGFQLDLIREKPQGDMSKFIPNGEWKLVDIPVQRNELMYECCPEPYPDVTFTIVLQRKYLFYLFNLVIPCFVIVLLTLLSFYLPPESGERISLVITNMLAIAVFMLIVAEILPPTSNEVSIISVFYTCIFVEVGIALIGTCVVLKYHYGDHTIRKMPSWVHHIVIQVFGRFFNVLERSSESELEKLASTNRKNNFVSDTSYLETLIPNEKRDPKLISELRKRQNGNCPRSTSGNSIEMEKTPDSLSRSESQVVNAILSKQDEMADHMSVLAEAQTAQDKDDMKKKEWVIAAVIFDRLFFCLFIFSIFISTVVILCSIPRV